MVTWLAMTVSMSRRRLLQAAALAPAAAACTSTPSRPATVDPDVALRGAAIARERSLVDDYAAAAGFIPAVAAHIAAVRADHEQHLAALHAPSPSPSAPPVVTPSVAVLSLVQLATAEREAAAAHAADALRASRPLAVVLASLAASEASHPIALT